MLGLSQESDTNVALRFWSWKWDWVLTCEIFEKIGKWSNLPLKSLAGIILISHLPSYTVVINSLGKGAAYCPELYKNCGVLNIHTPSITVINNRT